MGIVAIVKPRHDCNFNCKYCYVDREAEQGIMSFETLENTIEQVLYVSRLNGGTAEFIWRWKKPYSYRFIGLSYRLRRKS